MRFEDTAPYREVLNASNADKAVALRFSLPRDNYLHLGEQIALFIKKRFRSLHPYAIEALGLSYVRATAPLLYKYLRGRLTTFSQARAEGPRGVANIPIFVDSDGADTWGRAAACAIAAAIALRRMDMPVDLERVTEMLEELSVAMRPDSYQYRLTRTQLLYAASEHHSDTAFDSALALLEQRTTPAVADIGLTLLKQGEEQRLLALVRRHGEVYFVVDGFSFWPLMDWLRFHKNIDTHEYGRHQTQPAYAYNQARKRNTDPPPWWKWLPA